MNLKKNSFTFNDLVLSLREVFADDQVEVERVKEIMFSYTSNPAEWKEYAHFDRHRYTRNLVDNGNGKYNLILICWAPGQGSSIHDHANSHCFMKMMTGSLLETCFAFPKEEKENSEDAILEMKIIGETSYKTEEVTYINDSIGLHRVENRSHIEPAVSLHLYIPPISVCRIFDQGTGKSTQVNCNFFSKETKRTPYSVSENEGILVFNNN